MHHEAVILCIDEGTSGTRAAVVGRDGQVSAQDYLPLEIHCPRPGVVEQDADLLLERTLDVCRRAIARAQGSGQQIVALAIANQRCSAVLWDTATGRSLAPIMVWQDSRHRDELALLAGDWDARLIRHAGRPVGVRSPYLWAAHKLRECPAVAQAWQQRRLAAVASVGCARRGHHAHQCDLGQRLCAGRSPLPAGLVGRAGVSRRVAAPPVRGRAGLRPHAHRAAGPGRAHPGLRGRPACGRGGPGLPGAGPGAVRAWHGQLRRCAHGNKAARA